MARLKIKKEGQWSQFGEEEVSVPLRACIVFDDYSNILGDSLNITSIKKLNTGWWQHSFETPPPDGHYCGHMTSDFNDWTSRNDVCQIFKSSYSVVEGSGDYFQTYTSVERDSGQNCGQQSVRIYW